MYRAAMQTMFSELVRQDRLLVTNAIEIDAPKTKLLVEKLKQYGLERALILVEAYDEKLELAARNLPYVEVLPVSAVDPLSLVRSEKVLATTGAIRMLEEQLA
jgi:large subunit ribosomal protein L4